MNNIKENYRSVEDFWKDFLKKYPQDPISEMPVSFHFCDNQTDADECADLVVKGIKQATATSLWWFEKNREQLPEIGDRHVITDWSGKARAIIETTKIEKIPFKEVTAEFAEIEGEGDKSLDYWKKVHKAYYTREMQPYEEKFREDMIIVCEHFKTVFAK